MLLDQMPMAGLSEATRKLVTYWQSLPQTGEFRVPERRVFQSGPVVAPYLSELFIIEWKSVDEIFIRLSGTKLDRILGREVTGENLFDLLPPELCEEEKSYYQHMKDSGCAGMLTRAAQNLNNFPIVYRTVHLPLADKEGNLKYWIGTGSMLSEEQVRSEYAGIDFTTVFELGREFFQCH
ncbi:PAS domain-containing protein [Kordiimonas laminariae]|uniref:PAS domain-containing protein n=1 Tax=Kordiimonas laminariae TaxID=2917717 RepID=UPI001FF1D792|nr:PAS domain-containing protein [Kordiimonas laminariae]